MRFILVILLLVSGFMISFRMSLDYFSAYDAQPLSLTWLLGFGDSLLQPGGAPPAPAPPGEQLPGLPPASGSPFSTAQLLASAEEVYYGIHFFSPDLTFISGDSIAAPAADLIKVFLMHFVLHTVERGVLFMDTTLAGTPVRILLQDMVTTSDGQAANTFIDTFGLETINSFLRAYGYQDTLMQHRMLDFDALARGLANYTSTNDALLLLGNLQRNRQIFPYSVMLELLQGRNIATKIPQFLPAGVSYTGMTGDLGSVENDMGLVSSPLGDFAIVVLTNRVISSQAARQAIGTFARDVYDWALQQGFYP